MGLRATTIKSGTPSRPSLGLRWPVAAGDVVHEDSNDTHYLPSGAKTAEAALTPVKRETTTTVPWCEASERLHTWQIVLLIGGIFVGCIVLAIGCCLCFKAILPQ